MGSTTAAAAAAATLSAPHVFHMGQRSERLDRRAMHGEIRGRAAEAMRQHLGDAPAGVILMQGGGPWTVYSTDMEGIFRQESYFQHLFGVENDGFYGAVDLRSGKSLLFMPRLPPEHAVWMGAIDSPEFNRDKYGVDEVHYVDEMAAVLRAAEPPCLHTLAGTNTDRQDPPAPLPPPPPKHPAPEASRLTAAQNSLRHKVLRVRVEEWNASCPDLAMKIVPFTRNVFESGRFKFRVSYISGLVLDKNGDILKPYFEGTENDVTFIMHYGFITTRKVEDVLRASDRRRVVYEAILSNEIVLRKKGMDLARRDTFRTRSRSRARIRSGRATAPAQFEGMDAFEVETACLHFVLTECRVHKTGMEIQALRYANEIASEGHVAMMRGCTARMMEYQLEAAFLHHCYAHGGCRHAPYTPICASGPNGAVLHYGHAGAPNNRQLEEGDMMVCDMGCEYYGYDSDITTSFPVGGKFSEDQRIVYGAVLSAFKSVIAALKPGVSWPDMHRLATRKLLEGLKAGGLLQGDVDDMMAKHVGALFFPCGLGHFIGLDTHDVGGYPPGFPERILEPSIKALRTARVLEEGMVLTVEPGCYFNSYLLEPALADEALAGFFVQDRVRGFMKSGGVRLEDNLVITRDGCYSLTDVPREIDDVEAVMAGAPWPRTRSKRKAGDE
eukprot:jgi/Tetstr1/436111/TSEL_024958.t1